MAIDQREALIAAVRAQVEKEKAAKAAKLKKEQESLRLAGKQPLKEAQDDKPKYKTLSAEELAQIEEKKRRKRAEELGIDLEELDKETSAAVDEQMDKSEKAETAEAEKQEAETKTEEEPFAGVTGSTGKKSGIGLNLDIDGMTKKDSVKIIEDENLDDLVSEDGSKIISEAGQWQSGDSKSETAEGDDVLKIVPNRTTPTNDVKSMYDIDDDDDALGAEISKYAKYSDDGAKKEESKEEAKKEEPKEEAKASEEDAAKKRAAQLEERRKEEARKREEALAKEEARRKRLEEAERKANEQERRIAEAESKRRAAEAARKREEEAAARKAEEEAKKKAAEEARAKAAEEARKKAEVEARAKAKAEAEKTAADAKKKVEEANKALEAAKKEETEAVKKADEARKTATAEADKTKKEITKQNELEAARKKAEEETLKKEAEAEKKALEEATRKKAEEDALWKATEEALKKAAEDAKAAIETAKKATKEASDKVEAAKKELEETKKAEAEAVKKADEAKAKVESETKKKAEDNKKRAEEEAKKKADAEAKKKAAADARKKAADEDKKKADAEIAKLKDAETKAAKVAEDAAKVEAEAKKKAADAAKVLEDAKKAEEAAIKAVKEADTMKLDLTQPTEDSELPFAAYYLEKYTGSDLIANEIVVTFNAAAKSTGVGRNVVVMGDHGFGMTGIGEDFARSFYDMGVCKAKTIAKIKGQALNKVKLADAMQKLKGGCMVVESAGLITPERMKEILSLTAPEANDIVVILTGEHDSLLRLFENVENDETVFGKRVNMRGMANEDMVIIAKGYIAQRGFVADESVDGGLRNTIMAMETGNIDRMLGVVDDALAKCEAREKAAGESKNLLLAADLK